MNLKSPTAGIRPPEGVSLLAAGVAAILASTCCLGPLLLLMLGISGAWIGMLALLEPYRPYFIGLSFIALVLSWRRIWRPVRACASGESCAAPRMKWTYRVLYVVVVGLLLVAVSFSWIAPWFY